MLEIHADQIPKESDSSAHGDTDWTFQFPKDMTLVDPFRTFAHALPSAWLTVPASVLMSQSVDVSVSGLNCHILEETLPDPPSTTHLLQAFLLDIFITFYMLPLRHFSQWHLIVLCLIAQSCPTLRPHGL